jgi:hypothetical protein
MACRWSTLVRTVAQARGTHQTTSTRRNQLAEMASNNVMQTGCIVVRATQGRESSPAFSEIWDAQTDATGAAYGISAMARSLVSDATVIRPPAAYPTVSNLVPSGAGADTHPSITQSPPASELPINMAIDNWWMDTDAPARYGAEGAHLGRHGVLPGEDTLATWQQAPFAFGCAFFLAPCFSL